jgi:hypothetical protein
MVEAKKGQSTYQTGRTLVKSDHGNVPVRVANITDKPVRVRRNDTLGWLHPVTEVGASDGKEESESRRACSASVSTGEKKPVNVAQSSECERDKSEHQPERLQRLLEKLEVDKMELSEEQREAVVQLVTKMSFQ